MWVNYGGEFDNLVRVTEESLSRGYVRNIEQAIIHNNPYYETLSIASILSEDYTLMLFHGAKTGLITMKLT